MTPMHHAPTTKYNEFIEYPDEFDFDDPDIEKVNRRLTQEIVDYDTKFRNDFLEEVHGVSCICPEETPEMVINALQDLDREIEYRIPPSEKQAYLRAQQNPNSYVHGKDFRLRFLRTALYDIPLCARRLVEWLNIMREVYGEEVLHRALRLSDFSKKELQLLRLGRYQFTPFGDPTGRRILVMLLDEVWESFTPVQKAKISAYMFWSVSDPLLARRGIVTVIWFDKAFNLNPRPRNVDKRFRDYKLSTTRCSAIHFAAPNTNLFRLRAAIVTMRLGRVRRQLKIHFGDSMEVRYSLQGYGIPIDQLPISYTGKIKVAYMRQWLSVRSQIENNSSPERFAPYQEELIEYPQINDVVFRQGSSCDSHPPNREFRNLIRQKVNEQEESRQVAGKMKIRRKKMVMDIITEVRIKHGGRFLIWNELGGWNELTDEGIIHAKIEYLIKEFRKSVRSENRPNSKIVLESGTSMFRSNYDIQTGTLHYISPCGLGDTIDEGQLLEAVSCMSSCLGRQGIKDTDTIMAITNYAETKDGS